MSSYEISNARTTVIISREVSGGVRSPSIAFDAKGQFLALAACVDENKEAKAFAEVYTASGASISSPGTLPIPGDAVEITFISLGPRGRFVAAIVDKKDVWWWSWAIRKPQDREPVPRPSYVVRDENVAAIFFVPDGRLMVTYQDQTAKLWDLDPEGSDTRPTVLSGIPTLIAISPDGQWYADTRWPAIDIKSIGDNMRTPLELMYRSGRLVFGPENKVAVISNNGESMWLSYNTTEPAVRISRLGEIFSRLAFEPDGRWLATTSFDSVRLWLIDPDDLARLACEASIGIPSENELHQYLPDDYAPECFIEEDRRPA